MIVHRDYTSSYDSVVKIFNNHIEFYNPSSLPDDISLEQLLADTYISNPRNKQIAQVVKELGWIEKYGSGIKRVRNLFRENNLSEPEFKLLGGGFFVRVFGNETPIKTPIKELRFTDLEIKILQLIQDNNKISITKIVEKLNMGRDTVSEYIEKLKSKKAISRFGSKRGGYWEVLE